MAIHPGGRNPRREPTAEGRDRIRGGGGKALVPADRVHGRAAARQRCHWILGGIAKRSVLAGHQNPRWLRSRSVRCGVRRSRQGAGKLLRDDIRPRRAKIFTDAQAAIKRMASGEPDPGQMYALQARKNIVTLRRARPDITIGIRRCLAHKSVLGATAIDMGSGVISLQGNHLFYTSLPLTPGNEGADESAELAAEEPDAPRGGMARILRPDGSAADAALQIPRSSQARGLREEVGGSLPRSWRPGLQEEGQDAEWPEAWLVAPRD